jgi:hypothetical protein
MKHSPQDNNSHEEHSRPLKRREFVGLAVRQRVRWPLA